MTREEIDAGAAACLRELSEFRRAAERWSPGTGPAPRPWTVIAKIAALTMEAEDGRLDQAAGASIMMLLIALQLSGAGSFGVETAFECDCPRCEAKRKATIA
jgi:hypothetical protein